MLTRLFGRTEWYKKYIFLSCILAVSLVIFWLHWGKISLGDNTVELTYGLMIKSGLVPYKDFYIHILPLTGYIAAAIEQTSWPIRITNILGSINTLGAFLIIYALGKRLHLSLSERVAGIVMVCALHLSILPYFNHHAFEVTLSGATALFIIFATQSTTKMKSWIWNSLTAVSAGTTFFLTQHIGLAAMAMGPLVFLCQYLLTKNKKWLAEVRRISIAQAAVLFLFLLSFASAGISLSQMFNNAFFSAHTNYLGTYGYATIWKSNAANVIRFTNRLLPEKMSITEPAVFNSPTLNIEVVDELEVRRISSPTIFEKVFLNKWALLNSILTLFCLALLIIMIVQCCHILTDQLKKRNTDPIILVWTAMLGTFILASLLIYQINFSAFYVIFVLWLYACRYTSLPHFHLIRNTLFITVTTAAIFVTISNLSVFTHEYQTRQYFTSRTGNERVWVSPFYTGDFVSQFETMAKTLDQITTPTSTFDAYPRASDVFYVLGKTPQRGKPMTVFYHKDGHYQDALQIATSSDILVVFEPKYYGDSLGAEHTFALQVIEPALEKEFTQISTSSFFQVYLHK